MSIYKNELRQFLVGHRHVWERNRRFCRRRVLPKRQRKRRSAECERQASSMFLPGIFLPISSLQVTTTRSGPPGNPGRNMRGRNMKKTTSISSQELLGRHPETTSKFAFQRFRGRFRSLFAGFPLSQEWASSNWRPRSWKTNNSCRVIRHSSATAHALPLRNDAYHE